MLRTFGSLVRAVALALLVSPLSLVAQTGNGSDVTGPATTGSTTAGGAFVPSPTAPTPVPIPPAGGVPGLSIVVPAQVAPLVTALTTAGPLPVGSVPGLILVTISPEVGSLVVQLAANTSPTAAAQITTSLSQQLSVGANASVSAAINTLLANMGGVLANPTPANIAQAVNALNQLVSGAPAGYLASPPPALQATLLLLNGLAATVR